MSNNFNDNFTIIFNKIYKKCGFIGQTNINEKIKKLIEQHGQINYEVYDYECSYKTLAYGPCGATIEIDEIYKIPKK
jgi:hypothetical protein